METEQIGVPILAVQIFHYLQRSDVICSIVVSTSWQREGEPSNYFIHEKEEDMRFLTGMLVGEDKGVQGIQYRSGGGGKIILYAHWYITVRCQTTVFVLIIAPLPILRHLPVCTRILLIFFFWRFVIGTDRTLIFFQRYSATKPWSGISCSINIIAPALGIFVAQ